MAFAALSIVSPRLNGPAGVGFVPQAGPLFGIVESGAGPYTVLWYNGNRVASVIETNLDLILTGSGTVAAGFVGRRVQINSPAGQNNYGIMVCVASYNRNGSEVLLLQSAQGQYYLEALASQCTALEG